MLLRECVIWQTVNATRLALSGGCAGIVLAVLVMVTTIACDSGGHSYRELEIRIEPNLSSEDAWVVHDSFQAAGRWYDGGPGAQPLVQLENQREGGFRLRVTAPERPGHFEQIVLRVNLAGSTRAEGRAYWYEESAHRSGTVDATVDALHGTVRLDKVGLPTSGDDRVIAYELRGLRDGRPVYFHGTIVVRERNLAGFR